MHRHDSILKWLFGPELWGMATRDASGQPLSTPSIHHIFTYEHALRKDVAKAMNEGTTWWEAWRAAMDDVRLPRVSFLSHVAIRPTNTVTAPGMRAPAPPAGARRNLALENVPQNDAEKEAAYRARVDKKRKAKADKRAAKAGRPQQSAILDEGGHQKGGKAGKGQGKGAKGGKLQGGLSENAIRETEDHTPICINYNKGTYVNPTCRYALACWF